MMEKNSQYPHSAELLGFLNIRRVPFMAVIHSFWDESGKFTDHKIVSLCGVCAPADKFQEFDKEWKELLRRYEIQWLSMKEATRTRRAWGPLMPANQPIVERIEALKPFADCVIQNIELGIVIGVDVGGYKGLSNPAKKAVGGKDNPHYLAFLSCVSDLVRYAADDDKITIVCDDDEETALTIFRFYRKFRIARDDARKKIVSIAFADDKNFPALQAADMLSFLVQHEARRHYYQEYNAYQSLYTVFARSSESSGMRTHAAILEAKDFKRMTPRLETLANASHRSA